MTIKKHHPTGPEGPIVLALETATPVMSCALLRGNEAAASLSLTPPHGHGRHLMQAVDFLSSHSGILPSQWSAVAVSSGPGSFTGLRVGLATAKALALGLGIPLYGVPTLEALAWRLFGFNAEIICPALDAKKGQIFLSLYRQRRRGLAALLPPRAVAPEEVPKLVPPEAVFTGDALNRYAAELSSVFKRRLRSAPDHLSRPDAVTVGRLALAAAANGAPDQSMTLVPEYIRASDAEINYGRSRRSA